jgi:hypothetical protein
MDETCPAPPGLMDSNELVLPSKLALSVKVKGQVSRELAAILGSEDRVYQVRMPPKSSWTLGSLTKGWKPVTRISLTPAECVELSRTFGLWLLWWKSPPSEQALL